MKFLDVVCIDMKKVMSAVGGQIEQKEQVNRRMD